MSKAMDVTETLAGIVDEVDTLTDVIRGWNDPEWDEVQSALEDAIDELRRAMKEIP